MSFSSFETGSHDVPVGPESPEDYSEQSWIVCVGPPSGRRA